MLSFQRVYPSRCEHDRCLPVLIGCLATDGGSCNRMTSGTVNDMVYRRVVLPRGDRSVRLQEVLLVERIKCPEDLLSCLDLLLATPDGSELVVQEEAPELSRGLRTCSNSRDEVIVERRRKCARRRSNAAVNG
jgi:hypothetical protein